VDLKAKCDLLNLAHVTKKYIKTEETKRNKCQCSLSSAQVQDLWRQFGRNQKTI